MLTILDYANHFGFKMIVGTSEAIKREIKTVEIDRPGLELTGFFDYHQKIDWFSLETKNLLIFLL